MDQRELGALPLPSDSAAAWLARFQLPSESREALKWGAAAVMVLDHMNAYIFASAQPWMYALGRLAFPVFGFVLAYNMAERPTHDRLQRVVRRLLWFAVLAQPFSMMLRKGAMPAGSHWWILNILFSLAAALLLIWVTLATRNVWAIAGAAIAFLYAGALLEFHWAGLIFVIASFYLCRLRTPASLAAWLLGFACLWIENGAPWGFLAVPVLALASWLPTRAYRTPWWAWYTLYPAHLAMLWLLTRRLAS